MESTASRSRSTRSARSDRKTGPAAPQPASAAKGKVATAVKGKDKAKAIPKIRPKQEYDDATSASPNKISFTFKGKAAAQDGDADEDEDQSFYDADVSAMQETFNPEDIAMASSTTKAKGKRGKKAKGSAARKRSAQTIDTLQEEEREESADFEVSIEALPAQSSGKSTKQSDRVSRPRSPPLPLILAKRDPGISPFLEPLKRLRVEIPEGSARPDPADSTHPDQRMTAYRGVFGNVRDLLESYMVVEDVTGTDERPRDLTNRIQREAKTFDRITLYRNEGRLISSNPDKRARESELLRTKDGDHMTSLVEQACAERAALIEVKRVGLYNARKIGQMILAYFEEQGGNEEYAQMMIERQLKALAKSTMKEVRKRWKAVATVIHHQNEIREREEAERKNKEHLQLILDQSTHFLSAQRDDFFLNDEEENEGDSDDGATPQPSVAGEEDGAEDAAEEPNEEDDDDDARLYDDANESSLAPQTPAPLDDESDDEFGGVDAEDAKNRAVDDLVYMQEMEEEEEGAQDDSDEDAGLLADADLPIEELLRKYKGIESTPSLDVASSDTMPKSIDNMIILDIPGISANPPIIEDGDLEEAKVDADDVEFNPLDADKAEQREMSDVEHDIAMDADEEMSGDDDEEMRALAAEAEAPLDSLLGGYLGSEVVQPAKAKENDVVSTKNDDSEVEEQGSPAEAADDAMSLSEHSQASSSNTSEEHLKVRIPFLLRGTLRPYQKAGLEWLASLYTNGLSGILADEMVRLRISYQICLC